MGFLDNSGDIILDAVLTDHGRKLLAKGDGSFQITKFALADDEINYTLYNASHASGSAYYDIEILQTPVLEAFTDNAGSVKSKLISYSSMNLLYLPVLKINQIQKKMHTSGSFMIAVDRETEGTANDNTYSVALDSAGGAVDGVLKGESLLGDNYIRIDQGIDSTEISAKQSLDPDLVEDFTLFKLIIVWEKLLQSMENWYQKITLMMITLLIILLTLVWLHKSQMIVIHRMKQSQAPRGTRLQFKIAASMDLNTSSYLFTQLGGTFRVKSVRHIDSIVRVTGMKTGYSLMSQFDSLNQ